jgi:biopolymer transport protein ExbB
MLLQISQLSKQGAQAVDAAAQTTPSNDASLSLLELVAKGGFLMIPIVLLSLVSLAIIIERFLYIRAQQTIDNSYLARIKKAVLNGDLAAATAVCQQTSGVAATVIGKAVSKIGRPLKEIEAGMEKTASIEMLKLERHMGYLGVIAGIAPMLGFIGTISGVIQIFYNISMTDNISIGIISGGLYKKMITSGAGLIVGVISYSGYHLLNIFIDRIALQIETASNEFLDFLQE